MTARNERPSAGWFLLAELALSTSCPTWCARHAPGASVDRTTDADGVRALCLYHAAQAVEDGDLAPADLTVAPAPGGHENESRDAVRAGAR